MNSRGPCTGPPTTCKCGKTGRFKVPELCYKCSRSPKRIVSECACGKIGYFKTPGMCAHCRYEENRVYDPAKGLKYYLNHKRKKHAAKDATRLGTTPDEGHHEADQGSAA